MGVNTLLGIGNNALFAHQAAINVTGNNIANVDTVGYSRQTVRFDEVTPIDARPGQIGQGTYAAEVYRSFNRFVENSYLNRFSQQQNWNEQATILQSVQSIFNEANTDGISAHLANFFAAWSTLAGRPGDEAPRQALLSQADNLAKLLRNANDTMDNVQKEMDDYINQSVNQLNDALASLQKINQQIAVAYHRDVNTPNTLYDDRDQLVRQIASIIDVRVVDNGPQDFQLFTAAGQPLVQGETAYSFRTSAPFYEKDCPRPAGQPAYDGTLEFEGTDTYEYMLDVREGNQFRVSLDGGKSWLRNEDGQIAMFDIPPAGEVVQVKNLTLSFADADGTDATLMPGDRFTIVPKMNVQWCSPTREPLNVTPQNFDSGESNPDRIGGGKLAAYFNIRDYHVGRYQDKLNSLTNTLIWEVNALHSQGAGLEPLTNMQGTEGVRDPDKALADPFSTLGFKEKLQPGSLSVFFYNADTGESLPVNRVLNFSDPFDADQQVNFDPKQHSLSDVARAINQSFPDPDGTGNLLHASIEGGKLHIVASEGVNFHMGADSTGLLAALGLNTFFQGDSAADIAMNPLLLKNPQHINAHSVDGMSEGNEGDGIIAARIAQLSTKELTISTMWENSTGSMTNYYSSLVGLVGSETQTAKFNDAYNTSLAEDLDAQTASISGVNLDEEMTNLIKFQHSYTAAAKLITTADQMLETILGLKQ